MPSPFAVQSKIQRYALLDDWEDTSLHDQTRTRKNSLASSRAPDAHLAFSSLLSGKGQEGKMSGTLDGHGQTALVFGTSTRLAL